MSIRETALPRSRTNQSLWRQLLRWLALAGLSIAFAVVIRTVVVGIYVIPTSSMEPTLVAGDVVLVSKLRYGPGLPPVIPLTDIVVTRPLRWWWKHPQRGDVVVFRFAYHARYPSEPEYFVKRIVGEPGDTLWVEGDSLWLHLPRRRHTTPDQPYTGRVIVPMAGMTIPLDAGTIEYWRPFIEREGNTVDIVRKLVLINRESRTDYTFKHDYYYVLGDNRARSFDSRWWGFVSSADIIGSPVLVLWSKSPALGTFRWERIGTVPR